MKSSHILKYAVSTLKKKQKKMVQNNSVSTHKPLHIKKSVKDTPSLLCGSLDVQPHTNDNYHFRIGDNYDEKRIRTLQSNEVRFRCKNSNSKNWQSLQVQHQLPYNMDSKIQTESFERQGGRSA